MNSLAGALQAQADNVAKSADPTTHVRIRGSDGRETENGEVASMTSGRVGRIRKGLLPQFDIGFLASNSTRAKRYFREREIHDLATMQHVLRAAGSWWRWSTMRSSISCGREHDI